MPDGSGGVISGQTDDVSSDTARERNPGDVIVLADVVGTAVFTITAVFAAVAFTTAAQWVGAVTAMGLFAVGVFAFLWSFWNAVQRSREEQISVTQIYLLLGSPTPPRVRRIMLSMLLVQVVVALATALARPNGPDGSPGSSLAVGILVPMFGMGLNGLWAAFHGTFEPRVDLDGAETRADAPGDLPGPADPDGVTTDGSIGQTGRHG